MTPRAYAPKPGSVSLTLTITPGRTHTSRWRDLDSAARFLMRRVGEFGVSQTSPGAYIVFDRTGTAVGHMDEVPYG